MRLRLAFAALLFISPGAFAGVDEALDEHILPGFETFRSAADALAVSAAADCTPAGLEDSYHATFDAWLTVGDIRLGPSETGALSIAFWPDPKAFTQKTIAGLIRTENPVIEDAATFAEVSIAGRGLFALEMLLFDPAHSGYGPEDYSCGLARVLANDLAAQAAALQADWADDFAPLLRQAGAEGNARFLSEKEALTAVYTQILAGLDFTVNSRLGRPMGTFDRPRPRRAEARRSGRSLRNAVLATEAAVGLAKALADHALPLTETALEQVNAAAAAIQDKSFGDIDDLGARFKIEILQQHVQAVKDAIEQEIGVELGLSAGFNSQDGD